MPYRRITLFSALLVSAVAAVAAAQAIPSTPSPGYNWTLKQASTDTIDYRRGTSIIANPSDSPFRFRDPNEGSPLNVPPPSAMDRAAVMGIERAWTDGRPPLDCARTPMDAACH